MRTLRTFHFYFQSLIFGHWLLVLVVFCAWTTRAVSQSVPAHHSGYLLAPKAFRVAAQKVLPSLVKIESYGGVALGAGAKTGKRRRTMSGISKPGDGPTTGLVISSDGYILTSTFNFIKKPPVITVTVPDGSKHVAKILGRDNTRMLVLLKIDGVKNLHVPKMVPRENLKVGQWAISVGVGYGDDNPAISAGLISATSRISGKAVQTDANISPANYGGPLVDIDGNVIGLCTPLAPGQQGASGVRWYDSGIGFAVPLGNLLEDNSKLLAQLKDGKTVQRGIMGIQLKPTSDTGGVTITKVHKGSPADLSGLKPGDQIIAVNDEKVVDLTHLRTLVGRYVAGEKIAMDILRDKKNLRVHVTLATRKDLEKTALKSEKKSPKKAKDSPRKKSRAKKSDALKPEPKNSGNQSRSDPFGS